MKNGTIWFDMDGTIANLYGVDNWLDMLIANDPTPYMTAKPMVRLSRLARMLNRLQDMGYEIGVISWLSKNSNPAYDAKVTAAKYGWLAKHLKSVDFDEIHIVPYGTPKQVFKRSDADILFDDEMPNRMGWGVNAYDENHIFETLAALAH